MVTNFKKTKKNFHHNNKGFTLAEILITIGIIGTVAALAIPNLVVMIQDNKYKEALKKVYSDINQATIKMVNANGGKTWDLSLSSCARCLSMRAQYIKYLNLIKTGSTTNIFSLKTPFQYTYYDSSNTDNDFRWWCNGCNAAATGSSGVAMVFQSSSNVGPFSSGYTQVGRIMFDLDGGNKGPNQSGKDLHSIVIARGANGNIVTFLDGAPALANNKTCTQNSGGESTSRGCTYFAFMDKLP